MSSTSSVLERKILERTARVAIIGLGYVGLPEAVMFAQAGFPVTGFDVDPERVNKVNAGDSFISDVSSEVLATLVSSRRLRATHMPSSQCQQAAGPRDSRTQEHINVFSDQDCLCICVPTPLRKTRDPDISYIVGAVEGFQSQLRVGQLVILESTTYPGTTQEVVQPMLEAKGLKAGSDFHLAFSPERVNPGDSIHPPASIPKVVGGLTPECTRLASLLYEQVVTKVLPVSSPRAAEMVKLLENTFRSVNIGLVNELALMCDRFNLDVWEIIDAAGSKPFGFMPFYPGPGLGGHCIPVDPFYLSWKARSNGFEARFIELAGEVNSYMPKHVIHKVADALNDREQSLKGSRILILGVAYKPDVSDTRESPALEIIHLLRERGAYVFYHDPHVPELRVDGILMKSIPLTSPSASERPRSKAPARGSRGSALGTYTPTLGSSPPSPINGFRSSDDRFLLPYFDCVVIVTHHSAIDYNFVVKNAELIVDTRNATKDVPFGRDKIVKL
jgi:UDP-N-acetyl-D-glucosamine dehydrogenase